jgi:hypothetical protein
VTLSIYMHTHRGAKITERERERERECARAGERERERARERERKRERARARAREREKERERERRSTQTHTHTHTHTHTYTHTHTEGGETNFMKIDTVLKPPTGSAVLFYDLKPSGFFSLRVLFRVLKPPKPPVCLCLSPFAPPQTREVDKLTIHA